MEIKKAEFIISAVNGNNLPKDGKAEFVFCGRSNVGKSSFINMLCNRKSLARTSSNPGKTQTLNIFGINDSFYFVDVPGYGFANVSKSIKASFAKMIETYIKKREELQMVFLLIDFRHKPSVEDQQMYEFIKYYGLPCTIILTKSDKLKQNDKPKNKKMIKETLNLRDGDKMVQTSVLKKEGVLETLSIIEEILKDYEPIIYEDDSLELK